MDPSLVSGSAIGLVFLLGLRHGLDPDHIAVIDNLTMQAIDERPKTARWTGTFFAIGHSISVALVALSVAWLSGRFAWPSWIGTAVDMMVIGLLLTVGTSNLRALLRPGDYAPAGWRQKLVPARLRATAHPLAVIVVGIIFGLVFDTATQAAAWGTVAASGGGAGSALIVAGAFAGGMILIDTADSHVVARLLQRGNELGQMGRYRRVVGWAIVAMSFGMALYAALVFLTPDYEVTGSLFTFVGASMFGAMVVLIVVRWRREERRQT
jgi:high-affinity nickel-transport protein